MYRKVDILMLMVLEIFTDIADDKDKRCRRGRGSLSDAACCSWAEVSTLSCTVEGGS